MTAMKHLILAAWVLVSCSTQPAITLRGSEEHSLPVVDITKEYPLKIVYAQDIAEVEYIPLETNDSTLVGGTAPDAVSRNYIVWHNNQGQVFVFNRQGKRLYSFNHRGGSHKEYNSIYAIVLDEERSEIYIEDYGVYTKILVYSLEGAFKRRLLLPEKLRPTSLQNFGQDSLFCYNSYYMDTPRQQLNTSEVQLRENPYFFISKSTGEITPLRYRIPERITNMLDISKDEDAIFIGYGANIEPLVQNDPDILISEFSDDTIYSLKDRILSPVMIKKPSAHKMVPPMMVAVDFFTDKYIFIRALEKIFDGTVPKQNDMVYDKHLNVFYQLVLLNKDYSIKRSINGPLKGHTALPHNTGINVMVAEYLIRDYRAGKLKGELKQITSKLKEDDNPVLILIKFKE